MTTTEPDGIFEEHPCPFCGEATPFYGLEVYGPEVDWTPCCYDAREFVGAWGWEEVFRVPLRELLTAYTGLAVREVILEGDAGSTVYRCRLAVYDPGPGTPGWRTEVFEDVDKHHRHHDPPQGWKFGVAVFNGRTKVGVAVVGRPVARKLQEKEPLTLEVTRVCVWGDSALRRNAASKLYGACAKRARRDGYNKLVTYTLAEESGASLRAAGFEPVAQVKGRSWDRSKRRRTDKAPTTDKVRWERRI